MWTDNETIEDLIGFKIHADLIRAAIMNPAMLPITIGVFGDWGGGKTSIMKMLENNLNSDNWPDGSPEHKSYESVAVVYVNTWLFEGYDDAKAAILSSILLELSEHKRFGPKIRDAAIQLLSSVNWMRFTRMAMKHVALPAAAAFFTGSLSSFPTAVAISAGISTALQNSSPEAKKEKEGSDKSEWDELLKKGGSQAQTHDVRTFRQRFGKMLSDGGIKTLVVLVDDLDRCTPERIVENLEAVKLFLSVDQTAFIIGADRRIVEHALRSRYVGHVIGEKDDLEDTRRLVRDYLEKLVQVPYTLPRLSAMEIETYMALLFCQKYLTEEQYEICIAACEKNRAKNRYASFGYAGIYAALNGIDKPELAEALTLVAAAAPLISDGLKGNPRQVKRFLNTLLLRKELARLAKLSNIRDNVLIKLMILEYVNTELFTQLFIWQSRQDGHPKELADLEDVLTGPTGNVDDEESAKKIDPKWSSKPVRRWIAMEPLLKGVDLRDYFWVARDRLESTFSGISMVPPIVRIVLDDLTSSSAPRRNSAMKAAVTLIEDERISLLELIEKLIIRQPEDIVGYNALRFLIETDLIGAAELLTNILLRRPLEKVPPAVGMDFMNLYNAKPELRRTFEPAKDHLCNSETRIGKAVKRAHRRD